MEILCITTNSFLERKRAHNKIHLTLLGTEILSINSFALASIAESAAIATIHSLVKKKVIGGTWNKSFGYDSLSLMNCGMTSKKNIIYLIYSPRPFEKPKCLEGSLKMKSTADLRTAGKFFSIQSNQLLSYRYVDRHLKMISRQNYPYSECNAIFSSAKIQNLHTFNYHTNLKTNAKCYICGYTLNYSNVLNHLKVQHSSDV